MAHDLHEVSIVGIDFVVCTHGHIRVIQSPKFATGPQGIFRIHSTMSTKDQRVFNGPRAELVLAFDVGTTHSGISYTILEPGEVPDICNVTRLALFCEVYVSYF